MAKTQINIFLAKMGGKVDVDIGRFFSLLAVGFGLLGSIILARGPLVASPEEIVLLTSPYSRWTYAPEQIDSLAQQQADARIGLAIIFLAFLIQFIVLSFSKRGNTSAKMWWGWISAAAIFTLLLAPVAFSISAKLSKHLQIEISKVAVRNYCRDHILHIVEESAIKSVETMASDLLSEKKGVFETRVDFFRRIAESVEFNIPEGTDFSHVRDPESMNKYQKN